MQKSRCLKSVRPSRMQWSARSSVLAVMRSPGGWAAAETGCLSAASVLCIIVADYVRDHHTELGIIVADYGHGLRTFDLAPYAVPGLASSHLQLGFGVADPAVPESEEHTSELQSFIMSSYSVLCWKKKH